jgi:hypothetical protein
MVKVDVRRERREKREMNILKANTLVCKADVIQRLVFRIVWITIPGVPLAFIVSLLGHRQLLSISLLGHPLPVYFLSVIIAVPLLGAATDAARLKARGSSNS